MDDELVDHQKKCRFCLGKIRSTRLAVQIGKDIKQSFFSLTNAKLKTSRNYSSIICKNCLKDLESSVGFQQKIIVNQQRLETFEFDDTVPVKEEAVEAEDLRAVEIKTECFEFEPAAVVSTWLELPKKERVEPDIKSDQDDVPEESPASANSDDDFNANSPQDESSENSDSMLIEEPEKPVEKASKATETSQLRICPYCAEEFTRNGIKAHIEKHENEINNTPLVCEFCDFQCFNRHLLARHCRSRHPDKVKPKKSKSKLKMLAGTEKERRELIFKTVTDNPTWNLKKVANSLKIPRKTVSRVVKFHRERQTFERKKGSGRKISTQPTEQEKRIADSIFKDPQMSSRKRGMLLGISCSAVRRYLKKMGFKIEVDESTRIYQCQQCPRKYSHNTTLTAHIKDKHLPLQQK